MVIPLMTKVKMVLVMKFSRKIGTVPSVSPAC